MVVYKIFHIPTGKYVMSMMDRYNLKRYPASGKIELGKKGKNWQTKDGVIDAFNNVLSANCSSAVVPYVLEQFEIHELTLQVTDRIKP